MDPAEVEFVAEKEIVTIIPNFKGEKMYLLSVSSTILFKVFTFMENENFISFEIIETPNLILLVNTHMVLSYSKY